VDNPDYNSPYIQAGINAYLNWIKLLWPSYCKRNIDTAFVGNVMDLRKAKDIMKEVRPPYLLVALARIELNTDMGGGAKRFHTINTGMDISRSKSVIRHMAPVRIGFVTRFVTDKGDETVSLASLFLNNYPGTVFYFEDNTGLRIGCRLNLDSSVDLPQADIGGPGDLYAIEPVISLNTWIGTTKEQGLVKTIKVNLNEGTGGVISTISLDVENGLVQDLDGKILKYTDPFDKKSSQWKGE